MHDPVADEHAAVLERAGLLELEVDLSRHRVKCGNALAAVAKEAGVTAATLERFRLVHSTAVMVLLSLEVTMAPYSMDLRERVVGAWDTSGDAEEIAATFGVSRAWVHRLVQRRRETGSIAPRQQTKFRSRVLAGQEARLAALIAASPDATLAELREALPTTAALSTLWLEIERLGLTVKKNGTRRGTTPARRRR